MKSDKNSSTGSLKGKTAVYIPEKRMWVYTDTKKQADDYIKRLNAKEAELQASRHAMSKKTS